MYPLRFPNSGIKAKRCRIQGPTDCDQALYKGRPPIGAAARKGRPPTGMASCGQPAGAAASDQLARASRQRPARKGLPPADSPVASKGGSAGRRGGRPLAGRLPVAKGSRRLRRGSRRLRRGSRRLRRGSRRLRRGSRRLRRGSDDGGAVRVKEG
ncbi:hypothetical protein BHM03_00056399 [Ensete ventricosum]|nr:hypothetical protein BHM03_00056399 [Ensete ventricosum]